MPKKSICLNMIVKNEGERIERCLSAVLPYVTAVHIHDTGSTDDTVAKAKALCDEAFVPFHATTGPFEHFSQARNDALDLCRAEREQLLPAYDYIMFCDADMCLVVDDPKAFDTLTESSYDMLQKNNGLAYWNKRLVRWDVTSRYSGVTHETFNDASITQLQGAWFDDHADGANRVNKLERDIKLLSDDILAKGTDRSWFYLANSHRDAGEFDKAAAAYQARVALGGWDEEVWNAALNYARCKLWSGDKDAFVNAALHAYNLRPTRAEPLYDLAKFYRERGDNNLATMFAEKGLELGYPKDVLFVEDYVYRTGLREEYAIAGYYDPAKRDRAFVVNNALALDSKGTEGSRRLARHNTYFFLQPLRTFCPSFHSGKLKFKAPEGYYPMNPSITRVGNRLAINVRCVNYRIDEQGRYLILGDDGTITNDNPINTRNFLCYLDGNLDVTTRAELIWNRPDPQYKMVIGAEDVRLVARKNDLFVTACIREQNPEGWCEQLLGRLEDNEIVEWKVLRTPAFYPERQHEKNWTPFPVGEAVHFMYRLGVELDGDGQVITVHPDLGAVENISGSSPLIKFNSGWLGVVHESAYAPGTEKRYYSHRFVWFDSELVPRRLSLPFVFDDRQIEFCAGLARHTDGNRLVLSYGVRDMEAHVAYVDAEEVTKFLWKVVS